MIKIGKINKLKILRETPAGLSLDGDDLGELILPKNEIPADIEKSPDIDVFIYHDGTGKPAATKKRPYVIVGELAYLRAAAVSEIGAFLDWGLPKDLFVPVMEQSISMEQGKSYIVYAYIDSRSGRITASSKIKKFIGVIPPQYTEGQRVSLFILDKTNIGYKAIVNNSHNGVLYDNEVFEPLQKGLYVTGFIKKLREDGKIDLCLQKPGYGKVDTTAKKILKELQARGGFMPVSDKSDAEDIKRLFSVSKTTFKSATGLLYKMRKITIEQDGIRLRITESG